MGKAKTYFCNGTCLSKKEFYLKELLKNFNRIVQDFDEEYNRIISESNGMDYLAAAEIVAKKSQFIESYLKRHPVIAKFITYFY